MRAEVESLQLLGYTEEAKSYVTEEQLSYNNRVRQVPFITKAAWDETPSVQNIASITNIKPSIETITKMKPLRPLHHQSPVHLEARSQPSTHRDHRRKQDLSSFHRPVPTQTEFIRRQSPIPSSRRIDGRGAFCHS
jgi:hypothetical protein